MKFQHLPIDQLIANPYQPRADPDKAQIDELAMSISQVGLIHPPLVYEEMTHRDDNHRDGKRYTIVAGERRFLACQRLGWTQIPAWIIESSTPGHLAQVALVENLQRSDLNPMEVAQSLQQLRQEFNYSHEQIADSLGKKRSSVSNYLRLLQLDPLLQTALRDQQLSLGHAKLLAGLSHNEQRLWLKRIQKNQLSVHALEQALKTPLKRVDRSEAGIDAKLQWQDLREALVRRYGLRAQIQLKNGEKGGESGVVKLYFSSPSDLHRLAYDTDALTDPLEEL